MPQNSVRRVTDEGATPILRACRRAAGNDQRSPNRVPAIEFTDEIDDSSGPPRRKVEYMPQRVHRSFGNRHLAHLNGILSARQLRHRLTQSAQQQEQ